MNKKFIALISALSLCVSVVGCSKKDDVSKEDNTSNSSINIESMKNESIEEANTFIKLGNEVSIEGEGAKVENNKITITSAGTYSISGRLDDGQIVINAGKEDTVGLILNGVDITSSNSAPIYASSAKKVIVSLADKTENNITDGEKYIFEDESKDEPNAAIFSKGDLIFIGSGKLTINGNYNHGIVSKDKLKIQSGNISVTSKNDGIKGKDCINVTDGNITINSNGDGMQSNNSTDTSKGYVLIEGGKINITSGEDGIQAETQAIIKDGEITINSGGGSENSTKLNAKGAGMPDKNMGERPEIPSKDMSGDMGERPDMPSKDMSGNMGERPEIPNKDMSTDENVKPESSSNDTNKNIETNSNTSTTEETVSSKAIKASFNIVIDGGSININSSEDAIHSNDSITINSGTMNIDSGDDGIHSDLELTINGGSINISKSYEGIESEVININDGNIHVTSSDDGINASEASSESSTEKIQSKPGQNTSSKAIINIKGGYTYVDANGDGIDSNGNITMKDGTLIVNGPTNNENGSLDYDGEFDITGGTLIAAGSSGMLQIPTSSSSQKIINISLTQQEANTIFNIKSEDKKDLLTFAPAKSYQSVIVSTPDIKSGTKYTVSIGGNSTVKSEDGLYSSGNYSGGTDISTSTVSEDVTNITQEGATTGKNMRNPGGKGRAGENMSPPENINPSIDDTLKNQI